MHPYNWEWLWFSAKMSKFGGKIKKGFQRRVFFNETEVLKLQDVGKTKEKSSKKKKILPTKFLTVMKPEQRFFKL